MRKDWWYQINNWPREASILKIPYSGVDIICSVREDRYQLMKITPWKFAIGFVLAAITLFQCWNITWWLHGDSQCVAYNRKQTLGNSLAAELDSQYCRDAYEHPSHENWKSQLGAKYTWNTLVMEMLVSLLDSADLDYKMKEKLEFKIEEQILLRRRSYYAKYNVIQFYYFSFSFLAVL